MMPSLLSTILAFFISCAVGSILCFLIFWSQRKYEKRWYVRYPDGYRTVLMSKPDAKTYRELFGGVVYKDGTEKLPEIKNNLAPISLLQ